MSPSLSRFKGKAAEPILQRKPSVDDSLLRELLPKAALQLAFCLPDDDKEVVIFLVLFGRNAVLTAEAPTTVRKSSLKSWKGVSSKAGPRQQVCPSCPFSDSSAVFLPLMAEILSKKSPSPNAKYKAGFSCDCFSSYCIIWSWWHASPNRDTICDILDIVESTLQNCESTSQGKVKKKKKVDRKREVLEKKVDRDERSDSVNALVSRDLAMNDGSSNTLRLMDMSGNSSTDVGTRVSFAVEDRPTAMEDGPNIVAGKTMTGRKKSLFRGIKQKDKSSVSSPNMTLAAAGDVPNAVSVVPPGLGESDNCTGAVAIEIPENLALDVSSSVALGPLPTAVSQGKNNTKLPQHHRLGKRRSNQVLPLDYEDEDVSAMEREQEAVITVDSTHLPMSPRVADAGLGGRGFLARVFPDALGRVASRLWDLISFRLRSHAVEYH